MPTVAARRYPASPQPDILTVRTIH